MDPNPAAMELPECPVCLQPYDEAATVPRVLPCGHSACERCLGLLPSPPAHPNTVRCPACNQLVRLPSPVGPKSLPKNIDLLRFCSLSSDSKPSSRPEFVSTGSESKPEPDVEFIPRPWTEDLLHDWKPWILPPESIALMESSVDQTLVLGTHRTSVGHKNQQKVSLFPIYDSPRGPKWFHLRYTTQVMEIICKLGEKVRAQLKFLLDVCSRQRSGICRVLGLWMNPDEEASALFLVCETFNHSLASVLNGEGIWRLGLETVEKFGFGMVGMELCEVVMSFHSEGVVFGCLSLDCFSFDVYGHCLLNLNNVLLKAKRLRDSIEDDKPDSMKTPELLSPEVVVALHDGSFSVERGSDIWSLGCILAMILAGGEFAVELLENFHCLLMKGDPRNFAGTCLSDYEVLREKVICNLDAVSTGIKFRPLFQMLSSCLQYHAESRPQVRELWCCIRSHFIEIPNEDLVASDESEEKKSKENLISCLFIGNMGRVPKEAGGVSKKLDTSITSENVPGVSLAGSCGTNVDQLQLELVDGDFATCHEAGCFQFYTLQGHQDCITGLAVGGGYLFSSSFDKTVSVWSLQDFSHLRSLKGHEHRVMSMIVMDETQPLCISGDSASGIFVWRIDTSFGQELQQKWYEHNDWRYTGIHSLAISGGYLYTGSGDKSIKAWCLQDYSLSCTMTGHSSTVSSLVVANGVLYSGSWDGTIRLWCLSDHSLLSVLRDDSVDSFVPILSLSVDHHFLVSAYENGSIKIWKNDSFVRSVKIQDGAIFAVDIDKKWLFTGGWSKSINIQELSDNELQMDIKPTASIACDSVITSLFSWHGKLFAGFSNKEIKVYYHATK